MSLRRMAACLPLALGLAWACAFDDTLRAYLDARFWLPFAKHTDEFENPNVPRISMPYAGMTRSSGNAPLANLRAAYQAIPVPDYGPLPVLPDRRKLQSLIASARADRSLNEHDRREVDLLDAKIDMRSGEVEPDAAAYLKKAEDKLRAFLQASDTQPSVAPELRSEAQGWLAHVYYLRGDQTAAGKIYLDELNRPGSNLSREVLLNSLKLTYGYDGGPKLRAHLDEYFDTPEHAAFAIGLLTNPHWNRYNRGERGGDESETYARIVKLLDTHRNLLRANTGTAALPVLTMRSALRRGDPNGALKVAGMVPRTAAIRNDPEFLWMLASSFFVSHSFGSAEAPLLRLFSSPQSSANYKAAAAYGLWGVYARTGNAIQQIRFALWLHHAHFTNRDAIGYPANIADQSIYWAVSGWDLALLLDAEAPDAALEAFIEQYPSAQDIRLVKYALAVRRARENRYEDAARLYESINATWRVPRMKELDTLYHAASATDLPPEGLLEAKYKLAAFIAANSTRIYFNDQLWSREQNYALHADTESGFTASERRRHMELERKLRDDQEEYWRAYRILRDVARQAEGKELRRNAARLGIHCLDFISERRFDRKDDVEAAEQELLTLLKNADRFQPGRP